MKRSVRRLFVFVSCLLLCAISAMCCAGCASTPSEDPELSAVKSMWNEVVVNQSKRASRVSLHLKGINSGNTPPFPPHSSTAEIQTNDPYLDACRTLDINSLEAGQLSLDPSVSSDTEIILSFTGPSDEWCLNISVHPNGQASVDALTDGQEFHAHVENWQVYDSILASYNDRAKG